MRTLVLAFLDANFHFLLYFWFYCVCNLIQIIVIGHHFCSGFCSAGFSKIAMASFQTDSVHDFTLLIAALGRVLPHGIVKCLKSGMQLVSVTDGGRIHVEGWLPKIFFQQYHCIVESTVKVDMEQLYHVLECVMDADDAQVRVELNAATMNVTVKSNGTTKNIQMMTRAFSSSFAFMEDRKWPLHAEMATKTMREVIHMAYHMFDDQDDVRVQFEWRRGAIAIIINHDGITFSTIFTREHASIANPDGFNGCRPMFALTDLTKCLPLLEHSERVVVFHATVCFLAFIFFMGEPMFHAESSASFRFHAWFGLYDERFHRYDCVM